MGWSKEQIEELLPTNECIFSILSLWVSRFIVLFPGSKRIQHRVYLLRFHDCGAVSKLGL